MPQYRSNCFKCDTSFDWQSPRMTSEDPLCPECGGATERGYFPTAAIWTKGISDYGSKNLETYQKDQKAGGHWTYERNSDAAKEAGRPLPVFIQTVADQKSYCRREGLIPPTELPNNLSVASDGKSYETANISEI